MGIFNRDGDNIEIPEQMTRPEPWTAEKPRGVVYKYKIITPTVNYYIEADRVIYGDIYINFFLKEKQVACISLNTVYGVFMIDSRPAMIDSSAVSSEVQP